jgi:hypothetical protein
LGWPFGFVFVPFTLPTCSLARTLAGQSQLQGCVPWCGEPRILPSRAWTRRASGVRSTRPASAISSYSVPSALECRWAVSGNWQELIASAVLSLTWEWSAGRTGLTKKSLEWRADGQDGSDRVSGRPAHYFARDWGPRSRFLSVPIDPSLELAIHRADALRTLSATARRANDPKIRRKDIDVLDSARTPPLCSGSTS